MFNLDSPVTNAEPCCQNEEMPYDPPPQQAKPEERALNSKASSEQPLLPPTGAPCCAAGEV